MDNGASSYRRFLNGDESGLTEIVRDYKDGLILYLTSIVGDIYVAEELAEDTFVKLVIRKPRDKGGSSFKTWLYTIARNSAIDYLRRQKRQMTVSLDAGPERMAEMESAETAYLRQERRIVIHRAMNQLNRDYRQILWLIYFEDFSYKEAAAVLRKSIHATEVLASRARHALLNELRKEGYKYEAL